LKLELTFSFQALDYLLRKLFLSNYKNFNQFLVSKNFLTLRTSIFFLISVIINILKTSNYFLQIRIKILISRTWLLVNKNSLAKNFNQFSVSKYFLIIRTSKVLLVLRNNELKISNSFLKNQDFAVWLHSKFLFPGTFLFTRFLFHSLFILSHQI
jgi:hypothetical protein